MKRQIVITKSFTNLSTQSFKQYLNDISKIDKFESPEEEAECAIKAINGDKLAKDELVRKVYLGKDFELKRKKVF